MEAVLADIREQGIELTYHLGDLVGYGPFPDAVVECIANGRISGVAGNYDSTVALRYKHCGCAYEDPWQEELSHLSVQWTVGAVSPETRRFLAALPFRLDEEGVLAVRFRRVTYDVERAAAAIESSALPRAFAEQLRSGDVRSGRPGSAS
ncbi:MAG TPA: hypothetical protein VNL96_11120 [Gemmatimonadaceae bacterium]|nr:hypothetical protein [Gemmatimonadaceae bacterium]